MAKHSSNGKSLTVNREPSYGGPRFVINDASPWTRAVLMKLMEGELPEIDVERECRYPRILQLDDYVKMYDRVGVATRTIAIYPEECWAMEPDIYESDDMKVDTEFELAWKEMNENLSILTNLQTADEVSGIGNFGIVLLGFNDGKDPREPVVNVKRDGTVDSRFSPVKLLYVRPLSQQFVKVAKVEMDKTNPRYGKPVLYQLGFANTTTIMSSGLTTVSPNPQWTDVHWTRVLHLVRNRKNSDILGVPELQEVFNDVLNIVKVLGANGQGYWAGGFPGISIETQPNVEAIEFDKDATKEEVRKYVEGLQRALFLEGLTAKSLAIQVADPRSHYETHLGNLCAAKAVPMRVFKGTEEAKLASSQDMRTWNKRLAKRQNTYITPFILREFFNRMFLVGALPKPKQLVIKWPDLNAPAEQDRATTANKITDSLTKYITGNVFLIMPPKEYLVLVLGYPVPQVEAILKNANVKKMMGMLTKFAQVAAQPKVTAVPGKSTSGKTKKPGFASGAGPAR